MTRGAVERLRDFRPSDLMWGARPEWTLAPEIAAIVRGSRFVGRAVTVATRTSVQPVLSLLEAAGPDDVMVIAAGAGPRAMLGSEVCRTAARKGVRAIVIDGAVRDLAEVRELQFPLFSRSHSLVVADLDPEVEHEINTPVSCGGVIVSPGDYVVGDDDGVLVIPQDQVTSVLETARVRAERGRLGGPDGIDSLPHATGPADCA